jgi:hypothetical protein
MMTLFETVFNAVFLAVSVPLLVLSVWALWTNMKGWH